MKVLIFGGGGMLGHKLVQRLSDRFDVNFTLHGSFDSVERLGIFEREGAIENVDVRNVDSIRSALERSAPATVINAVGVTKQVAGCENVESTLSVNAIFPHRLAKLSEEIGARLITISTDCVFAGTRGMYSEEHVPDALDLYGQSKHWGEIADGIGLTLRTSIIGRELNSAHGLLEWFISQRGKRVKGYSKAIFSGFPTVVFADIIIDIIERYRELKGIFHVSSSPITKFDLLDKVNHKFDLGVQLTEDRDFAIDRSLDSSKFQRATGFQSPSWDEMIERIRADSTPYESWKDRNS